MKKRPHLARSLAALVPSLALVACSGSGFSLKSSDGLERVDELLSHVERVRVESLVSKERAQGALESLRGLLAPEFRGDAASAHEKFKASVEQSVDQADTLRDSVKPLKRTGESMFAQWTEDLESFGNISMRQRSQERLEATRQRYDAILSATLAAQLAYDAFNGDLTDQALFLENDYNASSVAVVAAEQEGLRGRARELARRLEAVNTACQEYVEFSAPQAELERPADTTSPAAQTPLVPAAPKRASPKPRAQAPSPKTAPTQTPPSSGEGG